MGKSVKDDPSKSTRWAWAKQTPDGILSSGNLSADKVKHAWQLMNGNDPRHRITMDKDGARLGRTTMEAPGGMTLKLGQDMEREASRPGPFVDGLVMKIMRAVTLLSKPMVLSVSYLNMLFFIVMNRLPFLAIIC